MSQLIMFRAIQGIGAGGIMPLVMAVVGDVISPRQRGRYMGYFGGVFALASVAGPLLGGLFTDHLSWRWIFYINLPLGLFALSAVAARLHVPIKKVSHRIDFIGALLLAGCVICLLLVTVLGGITYHWGSSQILGLTGVGLFLGISFAYWEKFATEPILPPRLLRSDIFRVALALSLLSGAVMFGVMVFIPEYQQVVRGHSATESGLLMLPLVGGMLVSMITSGRLISKFGRYRAFPIAGTAITTLGIWLFSHITLNTSETVIGIWMVILGLGIGMYMQVMTLAVQNSISREDMGSATSVVTFARSMGASFGTSIFGALLVSRLTHRLSSVIPVNSRAAGLTNLQQNTAGLSKLPPALLHGVLQAFAQSFHDVFLLAVPFAALTIILSFLLRETPLKSSAKEMAEGQSFDI